jgi:hypothetical protein
VAGLDPVHRGFDDFQIHAVHKAHPQGELPTF